MGYMQTVMAGDPMWPWAWPNCCHSQPYYTSTFTPIRIPADPPSTAGHPTEKCGHCGNVHETPCPRIKAIEYFENGVIRRVEYHDA